MKRLLILAMSFLVFLRVPVLCQTPETEPKTGYGYAFASPGAFIGGDGTGGTMTLGGGGEGLIKDGFGIAGDISYLFPTGGFRNGIGLFSPGALYQFRRNRKTVPFVTGGYTLAFREGTYNLVHLGGGVNHWFGKRWGLRFEGRDHIDPHYPQYNFLQFRVAVLFR